MRAAAVERPATTPEAGAAGRAITRRIALALGATAVLVASVHVWGRWLQDQGHRLFLNLPPLVGHLDLRVSGSAILAAVVAIVAVAAGPAWASRLPWRRLLAVCVLAAAAWSASLAFTEGPGALIRSPAGERDYLHDAPSISSPSSFLRTYVEEIDRYTTHVRAHPPGMTLVAWSIDRLGGGPGWLAALEILVGASAVPAVLVALKEVADEDRARDAAPFLAFAPIGITLASSGDAFFAGVGAWAVTLVVLATGRRGPGADALALGGGLLFGLTAFLSYGLVLLGLIPLVVARGRRRFRPVALAGLGAVPVFAVFWAAGFSWFDGLIATRGEYLESVARLRPYAYFLVANVAAFALILGPAAIAGLATGRSRGAWWLVGGAIGAVALADVSGMSKAEVERIWLPFAVWVLAATSMLPPGSRRAWLAGHVGFGLLLELTVRQPW